MNHEHFMMRCLQLAKKGLGSTYPNPMVGSVIVHDGKIIGEGFHRKAGKAHAEINAINSVENRELFPHSTIYVSLEPCSHLGRTPPCALKIKEIGFKKVVIGAWDNNEKVNGKGIEILKNAGIETLQGICEKECNELNKRFFTFHRLRRPYIILKWAESADGFIDKDWKPVAISNDLANQKMHQLRAEEHMILVGTQTAINDNPNLSVRHLSGKNPVRGVLDFGLKIPHNYKIFNDEAPTMIFNSIKNEALGNHQFIKINPENMLNDLMEKLYENQIQSLIVEGGRHTLQQFIDAELWDEALVIRNPNLNLWDGTQSPVFQNNPYETEIIRDNEIRYYKK